MRKRRTLPLVVVQIPCLNEEATLPETLADIPRQIDGVGRVHILVIDDGSTDRTADVALASGADEVISFAANRGLGRALQAGFNAALRAGADVVVNTDGDNQYYGGDIPALLEPIIEGRADIVIGDRGTDSVADFSPTKRRLQKRGSQIISRLAGIDVPDVASGFRAYTREAILSLSLQTEFDHTAEHVIQAGHNKLAVVPVPIRTNPKTRESRLFGSADEFVARSAFISLRTWSRYRALAIFSSAAAAVFAVGVLLGLRFLYYLLIVGEGDLHIQSVVLSAVFMLAGVQLFLTGVVADLIATNRQLLEESMRRIKENQAESDSGAHDERGGIR